MATIVLALVCCVPPPAFAVVPSTEPESNQLSYRPGEIVVGFKSSGASRLTKCADCLLALGQSFYSATSDQSYSLDTLLTRFSVLGMKAVFRTEREDASISGAEPHTTAALEAFHAARRAATLARYPARTARAPQNYAFPNLAHVYRVSVPAHVDVEAAAAAFAADPHVEFAHPSNRIQAQLRPNDPFYQHETVPNSWGQPYMDLWGLRAINAESAWDRSTGAGSLIAVVDTGVDYTHEDLAAHIWINPGEDRTPLGVVNGTNTCPTPNGDFNCVDDDGNGFVDDIRGMDFASCDVFTEICLPVIFGGCVPTKVCIIGREPENDPMDGNGHGTHVAGTAAAIGNNGKGIAGVAWNATVMPVRILSREGYLAFNTDAAAGLEYAARMGADVINNSWGCTGPCPADPVLEMAVREAYGSGAVVVFSAGNSAIDVRLVSPQNMPETISVGAITPSSTRTVFSNYGELMDLVAPGGGSFSFPLWPSCHVDRNILSLRSSVTYPGSFSSCLAVGVGAPDVSSKYAREAGTSMAAPHVTGAAALLIAQGAVPFDSPDDVRNALQLTASDIGAPGADAVFGAGGVDIGSATTLQSLPQLRITSPLRDQALNPSQQTSIPITGTAAASDFQYYELFYRREGASWQQIGSRRFTQVTNNLLANWNISGLLAGMHTLRLTLTLQNGRSISEQVPLIVRSNGRWVTTDGAFPPDVNADVSEQRLIWRHEDSVWGYQIRTCEYDPTTGACPMEILTSIVTNGSLGGPFVLSGGRILQQSGNQNPYTRALQICTIDTATNTCTVAPITPSSAMPHPEQFDMDEDLIVWTDQRTSGADQVYACRYDAQANTCPPVKIAGNAPFSARAPRVSKGHIVWYEDGFSGAQDLYQCTFDPETGQCPPYRLTVNAVAFNPVISNNHIVWQDKRHHFPNNIFDIYHCTYNPLTRGCQEERLTTTGSNIDLEIWGDVVVWRTSGSSSQVMYHDLSSGQTATLLPSASGQFNPQIWRNLVVFEEGGDLKLWDLRELGAVNTPPAFLRTVGPMTFPEGPMGIAHFVHGYDADGDALTLQGSLAGGGALSYFSCELSDASWMPDGGPGMVQSLFTCTPSVEQVAAATGSETFDVVFEVSDGVLSSWAEVPVTITDATPPLTGEVRMANGTPVPFVTLKLSGESDAGARVKLTEMTNASGQYRFAGVPAGVYTITPRAKGYAFSPSRLSDFLWPADSGPAPFVDTLGTATPRLLESFSISGYVRDAQGMPVVGATIKAKSNSTAAGIRVRLFTLTDEQGFFLLDHLPPGSYRLQPRAPRDADLGAFTPRTVTLDLTSYPLTDVDFEAAP